MAKYEGISDSVAWRPELDGEEGVVNFTDHTAAPSTMFRVVVSVELAVCEDAGGRRMTQHSAPSTVITVVDVRLALNKDGVGDRSVLYRSAPSTLVTVVTLEPALDVRSQLCW